MAEQITRRNLIKLAGVAVGGWGLGELAWLISSYKKNDRNKIITLKRSEFTSNEPFGGYVYYRGIPYEESGFILITNVMKEKPTGKTDYYSTNTKQIQLYGRDYEVVSVNAEQISLRQINKRL